MTPFKTNPATIAMLLIFSIISGSNARAESDYILATGTEGGTYHRFGAALCEMLNETGVPVQEEAVLSEKTEQPAPGPEVPNMTMRPEKTSGSVENIELLARKKAHFAFVQSLAATMAFNGKGVFYNRKIATLRSVLPLWDDAAHFVVSADKVKTGNIADLAEFGGSPFSLGEKKSGALISNYFILNALGMSPESVFTPVRLGYKASAEALVKGEISGMSTPGGVPVPAVSMVFEKTGAKNARILEFTGEQLEKIKSVYPIWRAFQIPAKTYPGQLASIQTISEPNFMAVDRNVPEQDVYYLIKTVFENLPALTEKHEAARQIKMENAVRELRIPLHPGASRFYLEKGIDIQR